jgi:hypothetical protein|tara:strand:+ start:610 stop:864 length:255 start_codon:yes stop_codon:yes gene_type:complete
MQAMRDKIDMYDRCILALGHESEPDTPVGDMVYFLEEERNRVRSELKELEDGTHELFGSVDPRLFNLGDMSNADIATMVLDMKD